MTNNDPDTDDSNRHLTSRRAVMAAIAGGSLGAAALGRGATGAGDDVLGIGGGDMADQLSHLVAELYEGPESDLPSPGVDGRYFRITSGGSNWSTGDLLEDTGSSWQKADLNVGALGTEKVDITQGLNGPVAKIMVVGDCHLDADSNRFSSVSDAESRLDAIADDAHDKNADAVVWIGDVVDGADGTNNQKSNSEIVNNAQYAVDYIENQAGSADNGFPGEQIYVMGNHEQIHGDSTSELNAVYNEFGYAGVSETFFTVDIKEVTLAVLNTAWTDDDYNTSPNNHQLAPNMLSWYRSEVQSLDRPVIPVMHCPIFWDDKDDYQNVENQQTMAGALGNTPALMEGFYGHVHNDDQWHNMPESTDEYGNKWVHTGFIYDLDSDTSITPYGTLSVFGGVGFWHFKKEIANDTTPRQTVYTDSFETKRRSEAAENFLSRGRARRRDHEGRLRFPEDIDVLHENVVNGSGSLEHIDQYTRLQTGGSDGDSVEARYRKDFPSFAPEWYGTRMFQTTVEAQSTTNQVSYAVMGNADSRHFGFKIDGGDVFATVSDGTNTTETQIGTTSGGRVPGSAICIPGDMAQFWYGSQTETIETNLPPADQSGAWGEHICSLRTTANEAAQKQLDFGFWDWFVGRKQVYYNIINR